MRRWYGSYPVPDRFHIHGIQKGKMFVNTPNALEGNNTDKCDTAAADFQSKETGVIDGVGTEDEILGRSVP